MFFDQLLESHALLICRPIGELNSELARDLTEGMEAREAAAKDSFDRFVDVTKLRGISLSLSDVRQVAKRRREFNPSQGKVKAAIFAERPLAIATARLYEMVLQSDRIQVRVFSKLEDAAVWLEIDADKLRHGK